MLPRHADIADGKALVLYSRTWINGLRTMPPYSLSDIKRAIPSPYFERGLDYQRSRRVQDVDMDHHGRKLTGTV